MNDLDPCEVNLQTGDGAPVIGIITSAVTRDHILQVQLWQSRLRQIGAEDAEWNWMELYEWAKKNPLGWRMYVLLINGHVQAIMLIQLYWYERTPARLPSLYLDRLADAPWNRTPKRRRFRGIGRAMLGFAVIESLMREFRGRVGLHSLPGAISWYTSLGLYHHGFDPSKGLEYLEVRESNISKLVDVPVQILIEELLIERRRARAEAELVNAELDLAEEVSQKQLLASSVADIGDVSEEEQLQNKITEATETVKRINAESEQFNSTSVENSNAQQEIPKEPTLKYAGKKSAKLESSNDNSPEGRSP